MKLRLIKYLSLLIGMGLFLLLPFSGAGQVHELETYIQQATANYPALRSQALRARAAALEPEKIQREVIPAVYGAYQMNFATVNNITGMHLPQYLMPISGPPSLDNSFAGVFGSAAGLLLQWEPLTFGQRKADLELAYANQALAENQYAYSQFDHQTQVIQAYLHVLAAGRMVNLSRRNTERISLQKKAAQSLTRNGLRPGSDSARWEMEHGRALMALLEMEQQFSRVQARLALLIGSKDLPLPSDTSLIGRLPDFNSEIKDERHPLLAYHLQAVMAGEAQLKQMEKNLMPSMGVWGSIYARGSGVAATGEIDPLQGIGFQRFNYGIGIQISMPILEFSHLKPALDQQSFKNEAMKTDMAQASLWLQNQLQLADSQYRYQLKAYDQAVQVRQAAAYTLSAIHAQYSSGLATVDEVAHVNFQLFSAEADLQQTVLKTWETVLMYHAAAGNLLPFMQLVTEAP
jgi:outer membrane protein TolC